MKGFRISVGLSAIGLSAMNASAQVQTIGFDDIAPGRIGDHYAAVGVRFLRGDASFGASTGPRVVDGQLQSASVGNFGTAVSPPNVMVPGPGSNDDLWMYFYDSRGERTTVSSFGVSNDREGNPSRIYLDGFLADGTLAVRAELNGAGASGIALYPGIFAARISAAPGQPGYLGVDEFIFCPEPEFTSQPGELLACDHGVVSYSFRVLRGSQFHLWQAAGSGSDTWTDVSRDGALIVDGADIGQVIGTDTSTITIFGTGPDAAMFTGQMRVVAATPCGAAVSEPAPLRICLADFNCDNGIDGGDVEAFFADWSNGAAGSDINGDGGIDGADVALFFQRWEGGC